jgi:ADP-ribosylglycohydrolase
VTMMTKTRIAGAIYGLAYGDALGRPTEFMSYGSIVQQYGKLGHLRLPKPALFTDDTQMTIAVARAMNDVRWVSRKEFVRTLANEFVRWAVYDEPRAPGMTCLTAIARIAQGGWNGRWVNATNADSKGCGANMRVAPAAFISDLDTAVGVAQLQAAMTHGHPTALAATELTALAIRWAAEGVPLRDLPRKLVDRAYDQQLTYRAKWLGRLWTRWPNKDAYGGIRYGWRNTINSLLDVVNLLRRKNQPLNACSVLGGGWVAEEALALGLYYAIRYGDDPVLAISQAARTSGDSDSIASITGAIVGGAHGLAGWPMGWCRQIERRDDLDHVVDIAYNWSQW